MLHSKCSVATPLYKFENMHLPGDLRMTISFMQNTLMTFVV